MINPEEHFSTLRQLLKREREEDRKQYQQKIRNRSIDDRKHEGVCWYPLIVKKSYLGLGEKWVLEIHRTTNLGDRHLFQPGSSAAVFVNQGKNSPSATGIISRVHEDKITIMLNRDDPPSWIDEGKLGLDLLFDESTYDEMDKALLRLTGVKEGRLKELISIMMGNTRPFFSNIQEIKFPFLNNSQNEAIQLIRSAQDVGLVHGPPGTGKTTTMVQAITEVLEREKQVLVTAPSNAAVDLLVEKLHQQKVNVVRMGHPARVTVDVVSHTLDAQLGTHPDAKMLKDIRKKSEELRRMGKKYRRKYGREEAAQRKRLIYEARKMKDEALQLEDHMINDILNSASVIACTLVGANNQYLYHRTFKTVFIDESSQALEPASWIPIMKASRVIMAGDHKQLPPTVKSKEAMADGFGETLFERCMKVYEADVMLRTQYRMHPSIMDFSNRHFYRGELETAAQILNRDQLFNEPVEFIDTAGCGYQESINEETLSTYNTEEAHFTLTYLSKILEEGTFNRIPSVGVIAPYKAQVEMLRSKLGDHKWPEDQLSRLVINTVDAFQGQERDIMFISLTRSNPMGIIGFLADQRRMNVALTRARHKLVVIGDSATLSSTPFFNQMIDHFQKKNQYRSAFEYLY